MTLIGGFVLLMLLAFAGALWWRNRITRAHNQFQLKIDMASDEDHARKQFQDHLNKKGL